MKIAYYCTWDFNLNDGVTTKINNQVNCWKERGNEVRIFNKYKNNHRALKIIKGYYDSNLLKKLNHYRPDIVYIRSEPFTITQLCILSRFRCVIEINTDDIEELRIDHSLYGRLKFLYTLCFRRIVYHKVSGIVFVTQELQKKKYMNPYNKESIVCPNSIVFRRETILPEIRHENNEYNLIFIGTPNQPWHGIDRLERIAAFTPQITYHIVGSDKPVHYRDKKPCNVKYYGWLQRMDYIELCQKCDAAIGTLALYRKGLNEACPLKTREYISMGLPIIIGYNDTMFIEIKSLPWWVLVLPNDDSADECIAASVESFLRKIAGRRIPLEEIEEFTSLSNYEDKRLRFLSSLA